MNKLLNEELKASRPELREGAIVTSIGSGKTREAVDGKPLTYIVGKVKQAQQEGEVVIRFRDPSRFFELLDSSKAAPVKLVTTSYLPANARDTGAAEQLVSVQVCGLRVKFHRVITLCHDCIILCLGAHLEGVM